MTNTITTTAETRAYLGARRHRRDHQEEPMINDTTLGGRDGARARHAAGVR